MERADIHHNNSEQYREKTEDMKLGRYEDKNFLTSKLLNFSSSIFYFSLTTIH